jgi:hypothetical protein
MDGADRGSFVRARGGGAAAEIGWSILTRHVAKILSYEARLKVGTRNLFGVRLIAQAIGMGVGKRFAGRGDVCKEEWERLSFSLVPAIKVLCLIVEEHEAAGRARPEKYSCVLVHSPRSECLLRSMASTDRWNIKSSTCEPKTY